MTRASPRTDLESIYRAALTAVDPVRLISRHVRRRGSKLVLRLASGALELPMKRVWIAGAGKAARSMALGVARIAPELPGIVIAPGPRQAAVGRERIGAIEVLCGSHPVPDAESFRSTRRLLRALGARPEGDAVLLLLSGGASALLAAPAPGVPNADKTELGRLLLRAGAPIEVTNAIRKHVSAVKGGGLLRLAAPRRVVTLAISDVPGDSLATIGSGPAVPDPTTFAAALDGVRRHALLGLVPRRVRRRLEAGAAGRIEETVKPVERLARRASARVIGSNRTALLAAARHARRLGYDVKLASPLVGEAEHAARELVARLPERPRRPICVLAGGETTVTVGAGAGRGGRNQEFALACSVPLAGSSWRLLAAGTDGIDGATSAAGGFCDGATLRRAGRGAVERALREHDSNTLLASLDDLLVTGPTGTNVMDLVVAIGGPRPRRVRSR